MKKANKTELERFGVSIPKDLLKDFDKIISEKGYENRSEAIRDMMRDEIIAKSVNSNEDVVGTLTLVYDHHKKDLSEKLTHLQHDHYSDIVSTLHVHLDHDNCMEVLVIKGKSKKVQEFSDKIVSTKGVKHGKLAMTSVAQK